MVTTVVARTTIGVQVLHRNIRESGAQQKGFQGSKAELYESRRIARPPVGLNTAVHDVKMYSKTFALLPLLIDRKMPSVLAREAAMSGMTPTLMWRSRRRRSTLSSRTRDTVIQLHRLPTSATQHHGNEEASWASLESWLTRDLTCRWHADNPDKTAVTYSYVIKIHISDEPLGFRDPNAGCLRAVSRDSGPLRGDSVRLCRDDGICVSFRPPLLIGI